MALAWAYLCSSVCKAPFTRHNRLSNRFDNRLYRVYKHSTGLSNPSDNRFDNRLYRVYCWLSNRLYNTVWQPVERTVAVRSTRLSNRVCQTSCTKSCYRIL